MDDTNADDIYGGVERTWIAQIIVNLSKYTSFPIYYVFSSLPIKSKIRLMFSNGHIYRKYTILYIKFETGTVTCNA